MQGQHRYVRATIANVVFATSALALVCGAMIIGFGVWFVGRPMRKLIEQARRVGAGDLSRRLVLSQHDQIGELAAEMNAMCDRLLEANERAAAEGVARRIETLRAAPARRFRPATVGARLASGVAHELGAPLQVVSGRAKMIADGDVTGTEAEDYGRIIHEQVARMAAMIGQLHRAPPRGGQGPRRRRGRGAEDVRIALADRGQAEGRYRDRRRHFRAPTRGGLLERPRVRGVD